MAEADYGTVRARGTAHLDAGRYAAALEAFVEAEPLADDAELCGLLGDMAVAYNGVGNLNGAIRTYDRAIALCRRAGDHVNLSRWCQNLGLIRVERGELDAAETLLSEGVAAARRSGDAYQISTAVGNLANVFTQRGEYGAAVEALEEAERTAPGPRLRATWRRALLVVNRAWAMQLARQGAWHDARARARAGLQYAGDDDEEIVASGELHGLLAGIAYELGDARTAAAERDEAVELLVRAGRPDLAARLPGL
jgi:tetratricopeptide (TPR) repeat protein